MSGEQPEERPYTIVVQAFDLTDAEVEALFDRVADAAHALDEQLFCYGGDDIDVVRITPPTREDRP